MTAYLSFVERRCLPLSVTCNAKRSKMNISCPILLSIFLLAEICNGQKHPLNNHLEYIYKGNVKSVSCEYLRPIYKNDSIVEYKFDNDILMTAGSKEFYDRDNKLVKKLEFRRTRGDTLRELSEWNYHYSNNRIDSIFRDDSEHGYSKWYYRYYYVSDSTKFVDYKEGRYYLKQIIETKGIDTINSVSYTHLTLPTTPYV